MLRLEHLEAGTFVNTKDEDFVNFIVKLGVSKDDAGQYMGSNWRRQVGRCQQESSRYTSVICCEEMSFLTRIDSCYIGLEHEISQFLLLPMLSCGGNAKVSVERAGENSFKGILVSEETFGKLEWTEKYTEGELVLEYSSPKACLTEHWCRMVKVKGWAKCVKEENLVNVLTGIGAPANFAREYRDVLFHCELVGEDVIFTEVVGDSKATFKIRLDEEVERVYPGIPELDRKIVVTRAGVGIYKSVHLGKEGQSEEFTLHFDDKGLRMITGLDKKSGQICKMHFVAFTDICGTFRPISYVGFHRFGKTIGLAPDVVSQLIREMDAKLTISYKGSFVHAKYDSRTLPFDMVYKFDEEFDQKAPGIPDTFRVIKTRHGDTITTVRRAPRFSTRTKLKFTEHFLIKTTNIIGTDIVAKTILERLE